MLSRAFSRLSSSSRHGIARLAAASSLTSRAGVARLATVSSSTSPASAWLGRHTTAALSTSAADAAAAGGVVPDNKISLKFTLGDGTGSLQEALKFFWKHDINLTRLESRPSKWNSSYEFYVSFDGASESDPIVKELVRDLKEHCESAYLMPAERVPWFPRHISELDGVANETLSSSDGSLEADHPGFTDPEYVARRKHLGSLCQQYVIGEKIPYIEYTQSELDTWAVVYGKLMPLLKKHATRAYVDQLPTLSVIGYSENNIPQLQDISEYMQQRTGFRLRPVSGLLSARNFLYGLAFRVFFSTQYIRHSSKPLYTPEPDICHELIGHVPLYANKAFADFSQEIGLASIGATDEQILRLARCYWYSVEFGLCLEDGERKAYGAGLLSSFGELEYSMGNDPSGKTPDIMSWDPFDAAERDYPITEYQPTYYQAESFADAQRKLQSFSQSFARSFNVRYNANTQTIEVDKSLSIMPREIV